MTRLIIEKIFPVAFILFLLSASAGAEGAQKKYGPEFQLSGGIVPVYHFSIKPVGLGYKEYFFTGSTVIAQFNYHTRKVSTRFGLTWNLLFQVEDKETAVLNMLSPSLSMVYHLKNKLYGGMGLAGVIIPGKNTLDGRSYDTRFDLWFSFIGGYRIPLSAKAALTVELNYSLNVTHRQWSAGKDSSQVPFIAETKLSHLFTLYGGVIFPFSW